MLCWSFATLFRHDRFVVKINTKEATNFDFPLDGIDIKHLFD